MNDRILRILENLRLQINSDSSWLTHEDQDNIERKIDELSRFIDQVYKTRKSSMSL